MQKIFFKISQHAKTSSMIFERYKLYFLTVIFYNYKKELFLFLFYFKFSQLPFRTEKVFIVLEKMVRIPKLTQNDSQFFVQTTLLQSASVCKLNYTATSHFGCPKKSHNINNIYNI